MRLASGSLLQIYLNQCTLHHAVTVCGDQLCVLGGTMDSRYIKSMYACLMSDLFESCVKVIDKRTCEANIWRQIADVYHIVAKCPGLAGTVPIFGPMSRLCPGLPDFAALSRNPARLHK